ncbi:WXG100 family type VII secretion target, partial [Mycolicibacterium smegmatis]|nr:WXG100 family type VII secretion target [Mycolicibacterium smegmatis]
MDQLLGSGWKGGAASAYSEQWDKWHNGAGQ